VNAAVGICSLGLLRGALSESAAAGWNSVFIVAVRMRPQIPYGLQVNASLIKIENIDTVMQILLEGGNLNLSLTGEACSSGYPPTGLSVG
jgi:hypothetical protein